mmetsp:Transcript_15069/g.26641  ORF Transcript_15069/g.26641 Transcript_15069/m.26641 type:complete len:227 (-) Transcript_15069:109-789(-)
MQASHELGAGSIHHFGIHNGALGEDLTRLSLHAAWSTSVALLRLRYTLHLLNNDDLVACRHQLLRIVMLAPFREAHMWLFPSAEIESTDTLRNAGVIVEDFVKLPDLEKRNLVKVCLLHLPKLLEHRCSLSLLFLSGLIWNPERSLIILWVCWRPTLAVPQVLWKQPTWPVESCTTCVEILNALRCEGWHPAGRQGLLRRPLWWCLRLRQRLRLRRWRRPWLRLWL